MSETVRESLCEAVGKLIKMEADRLMSHGQKAAASEVDREAVS